MVHLKTTHSQNFSWAKKKQTTKIRKTTLVSLTNVDFLQKGEAKLCIICDITQKIPKIRPKTTESKKKHLLIF